VFSSLRELAGALDREEIFLKVKSVSSPTSARKAPILVSVDPEDRPYESIFIVKPSLSEEELQAILDKVKEIIEEQGGAFVASSNWGKKKLAYEVQKERKGIYVVLHFKGKGALVAEVERFYRFSESVIKHMTLSIDAGQLGKTEPVREERSFAFRGRSGGRGFS